MNIILTAIVISNILLFISLILFAVKYRTERERKRSIISDDLKKTLKKEIIEDVMIEVSKQIENRIEIESEPKTEEEFYLPKETRKETLIEDTKSDIESVVLKMHREGKAPEEIAEQLGITYEEINLILQLRVKL